MFEGMKNRFMNAIASSEHHPALPSSNNENRNLNKFNYGRPPFLQLVTHDELKASADHHIRPIIVPRDISILPFGTGYAECVNAGKSEWNEDQAAFCRQILSDPSGKHPDLPYTYFGIFDGHAGHGAALAASLQCHHILHEKLVDIIDLLLPREEEKVNTVPHPSDLYRPVTKDELIIGALEKAFLSMDALFEQENKLYSDPGGCTALVSLLICGKMFVANAGDSRAVLCQRSTTKVTVAEVQPHTNNNANADTDDHPDEDDDDKHVFGVPFSFDHTPETEKRRLIDTALLCPWLIGKRYRVTEFSRPPRLYDLGKMALCKQGNDEGFVYKIITREDLVMPVVMGKGKRSRLLGTLGVTRGFGDYNLTALNTGTLIKPFLSAKPDVKIRDLSKIVSIPGENNEDGDYGVLVMATDGLWDVTDNDTVAKTVFKTLAKFPTEKHRYTMAAQELVAKARGKMNQNGNWRLTDMKGPATVDDISVIVIPIYQYYKEHVEWERKCAENAKKQVTVTNGTVEEDISIGASALEATEINSNSEEDNEDKDDKEEQKEKLTSPEPKAAEP